MARQPFLHDLLIAHSAPTQAWSLPDGQIRPGGLPGWYHSDVRVLSHLEVTLNGEAPEVIASGTAGQGRVEIVSAARSIDSPSADPTVRLTRTRTARPGRITERLDIWSAVEEPVRGELAIACACDLALMETVKRGIAISPRTPDAVTEHSATWRDGSITATLSAPTARLEQLPDGGIRLVWDLDIAARGSFSVEFDVVAADAQAVVRAPERTTPEWVMPSVNSTDNRIARLMTQALDDIAGLRLATIDSPHDVFLAAGAPWFFTLFGRDSIIAARLMLPLTTDLAAGTLRTLARRQGKSVNADTAEQPGKILHELRRGELQVDDRVRLPPLYYGTVDATALWISLLHDAWRAGMPESEVRDLIDPLEDALVWMRDYGTVNGFLSYIDDSNRGLSNQGWKDSGDSVQFRDGTLAEGPIALSEVQAYAHQAAINGAAILDAFGRGGEPWRIWAADLADRFRAQFWAEDEQGKYLVIALDGKGRQVDTVTSNMGHVLGSGLLTPEESAIIADRLVDPSMSSGYGLRTLSTTASGYFPLKYHGGSVWPHDTAVVIEGLLAEGHTEHARVLALGLLDAAEDFNFRLPELFAGDAKGSVPRAVPYPASCRPQAWSAASAVSIAKAMNAI